MDERQIVERLATIFARPNKSNDGLLIGIGDDAAVLAPRPFPTAITTDTAIEDVHFKLAWSTPFEIGSRIATANLADICAMGGWPEYLVVAVGIPSGYEDKIFELAEGIAIEADRTGAQVIGGDISRSEKLMVTITALGNVTKVVTRSGAKVGDVVALSGLTGWSLAGLTALERNIDLPSATARYKRPAPNYEITREIFKFASAMCDVSDGLLLDAARIADASGVTIEIDPQLLPNLPGFPDLVKIATKIDFDPIDLALLSGEDHEFLFTCSSENKLKAGVEIGRVIEKTDQPILITGRELPRKLGWTHF